ncbi:F-box/kelch-repeat protein At1g57790-like [Carex rostrata]
MGQLAVIDLESLPTGDIVCRFIDVPRLFHNENCHLVVSNESVFTVLVKFSSGRVNDVEIYTLDTSLLFSRQVYNSTAKRCSHWVRVGSMIRRSFLLSGDYNISLSANYPGVQCNCIYVLQPDEDSLRLYTICLDDQTTTFKVLLPEETNAWNRLYWVVPCWSRSIQCRPTKTSTVLSSEGEDRTNDIPISWADLPEEMVQELFSLLPLPDRIRLASVCKSLNSFSKYIQDSKVFPWLMCSLDCGSLKFFDTFYGVEHSLQMKWLGSDGKLTFHFSKDGWIIASDRKPYIGLPSLFILNPLTKQGIKLPSVHIYEDEYMPFSFSSVPTNSDCIVLRVFTNSWSCVLYTWHRGLTKWKSVKIDLSDNLFRPTSASPVFLNGEFYILGREGDLLVFNPITKKYRFLNISVPVHSHWDPIKQEDFYLLELAGKLICVLKESMMASHAVYKLDQIKGVWVELDNLGEMTAFLSCRNSLSRPSTHRMYANGMLFPRFYREERKKPMFYSMQNRAFQPMSDDTREIMNCVWFEPNLFIIKKKNIRKFFTVTLKKEISYL